MTIKASDRSIRKFRSEEMAQAGKAAGVVLSPEQQAMLEQLQSQAAEIQKLMSVLTSSASAVQKPVTAVPSPSAVPPKTLRERIQEALVRESMDLMQLSREVHADRAKVQRMLHELREQRHVYNVGFEDSPVWTWKIGDEADGALLKQVLVKLISERPMYLVDLVRATGVSEKRISGKLVDIRRYPPDGLRVVDMSPLSGYKPHGRAKAYFLAPKELRDMSLQPKTTTKKIDGKR